MYGYGFLSLGFTDRREILHGGLATFWTGLLLFWGDSPRDGRISGVNRGPYGGMCFLLKHLFRCVLWLRRYKRKSSKSARLEGGWVTLTADFRRKGHRLLTTVGVRIAEWLLFQNICTLQCIVCFCHKAAVWWTDRQNYDSQDCASIAARTIKTKQITETSLANSKCDQYTFCRHYS